MALDPGFPTRPYVYLLYTYDAAIGGTAPRWGTDGVTVDPCPSPPGPTSDGCVVSGRLSRFEAVGNVAAIPEQVLIEDWCQQYPSHSIGQLAFGTDGALYVSGGDGASFGFADWGQDGNPLNPCGDPPVPVGGTQSPPNARGGALRSQSLRRPAGEPVVLGGSRPAGQPGHGRSPSDQPQLRPQPTPTPAASSPTGSVTRSGSRRDPARARSGWATSAGAPGRRSIGFRTRPRAS